MRSSITPLISVVTAAFLPLPVLGDEPAADLAQKIEKHQVGSKKLANEQDELSADVQELIDEQTSEQVIELLGKAETIMTEVIDNLDATDTGGPTIAAETEIIEMIFEAAKKKAQEQQEPKEGEPKPGEEPGEGEQPGQQPGEGQSTSGAMLDMMRRMMGETPGGEPKPDQEGPEGGESPGGGSTGDSDKPNRKVDGSANGNSTERRVPKKSGTAGSGLPPEFRKALDAYNRPSSKPSQP